MKTSIVIPALNEQPHITSCLDSAWAAGADQVIVVDGGSRDQTVAIAKQSASAVVSSPRGRGLQLNAGTRQSSGDLVMFLHADNRLPPDALRQIRAAAPASDRLWGAFRQRIDAPGPWFRLLEQGNAARARWVGLPYGDQAIFVSRRLFWAVGGFRQTPIMEDVDLAWRLRRESRPLILPGRLLVSARRWQAGGVVRQTIRNWLITVAWMCGVPPQQLARYYTSHATSPPKPDGLHVR